MKPFYDSYMDVEPFAKAELFLPYIGFVPLSLSESWKKTISVKYTVNMNTGTFTAYVYFDNVLFEAHDGSISISVPLLSSNAAEKAKAIQGSLVNGAIAAGSLAAGVPTPNAASAGMDVLKAGASMFTPNVVQSDGRLSIENGVHMPQYPFIRFTMSKYYENTTYDNYEGISSVTTEPVAEYNGITKGNIVLTSGPMTDAERNEIISLFNSGVFI